MLKSTAHFLECFRKTKRRAVDRNHSVDPAHRQLGAVVGEGLALPRVARFAWPQGPKAAYLPVSASSGSRPARNRHVSLSPTRTTKIRGRSHWIAASCHQLPARKGV